MVAGSVNRGQGRQLLLIVFRRLPPLKVRERIFFFFSMSLFYCALEECIVEAFRAKPE